MSIGKKGGGADWIMLVITVMFVILLALFSNHYVIPKAIEKSKYYITGQTEDLSNNLFIYGFLRQKIDGKNMADFIALSYMNQDYKPLEEKVIEILEETGRDVRFKIYINKKIEPVIQVCREKKCSGRQREFVTTLPLPNKEIITFKLVLYGVE